MEVLFWFCLCFFVYTYVGYPLTLWIMSTYCPWPVHKKKFEVLPSVTVVIAVKNEEEKVQSRLRNIAAQEYPGTLEIVLVSDNSTDDTVASCKELVGEFQNRGISLVVFEQNGISGKPAAVNRGVVAATGEIIVFADARQQFAPEAIYFLVENFSDPKVGCVSGELIFVDDQQSCLQVEMGAYWRYEKALRKMEGATGSVMGATGAIYAIRRELYHDLPADILLDDVLTPVNILCQGYRISFESRAIATDIFSTDVSGEWRRKVRTLAGNWQLIGAGEIRRALQHHFFFRFFWHKVARLLVPFALLFLFMSSFFLQGWFFSLCCIVQLLFYCLALFAWKNPRIGSYPVAKLCYFFCLLNWAVVVAGWLWITGKSTDIWRKS